MKNSLLGLGEKGKGIKTKTGVYLAIGGEKWSLKHEEKKKKKITLFFGRRESYGQNVEKECYLFPVYQRTISI